MAIRSNLGNMSRENEESKIERELAKFVSNNFRNNSTEESSGLNDINSEYKFIELKIGYVAAKLGENRIHETKLKLAQKAINKGCRYVRDIKYNSHSITAIGWKPVNRPI